MPPEKIYKTKGEVPEKDIPKIWEEGFNVDHSTVLRIIRNWRREYGEIEEETLFYTEPPGRTIVYSYEAVRRLLNHLLAMGHIKWDQTAWMANRIKLPLQWMWRPYTEIKPTIRLSFPNREEPPDIAYARVVKIWNNPKLVSGNILCDFGRYESIKRTFVVGDNHHFIRNMEFPFYIREDNKLVLARRRPKAKGKW